MEEEGKSQVLIEYYDNVRQQDVEWLWYPYIPYGKITLLQGDPGDGKSTFMLYVAAAVSTGGVLPDGSRVTECHSVIYQCSEDGAADTIKPRLLSAGADCERIAYILEDDQSLSLDDPRIEEAVVRSGARLVIFDPIQAYIPPESDMLNASKMRMVLRNLANVAERHRCAIVLIGHMTKASSGKNLYRGLGSIDIAAIARSVLMIRRDEDEPDIRKCEENDKDSLRWCIAKPDKRKSRKISSKEFSRKIYDLMGWNEKCRYKILGHRINYQDDVLYVFELDETEIVFERKKKTVAEAVKDNPETALTPEQVEERKKEEADMPVKPFYPDDWDNSFGVPVEDHKNIQLAPSDSYESFSELHSGQGGPG